MTHRTVDPPAEKTGDTPIFDALLAEMGMRPTAEGTHEPAHTARAILSQAN